MPSADFNPDAPRRRLAALLLAGLAAATTIWSLVPATCQAQGGHAGSAPAASVANAHPTWNELNAVQQRVLAPLAGEWNSFPELNRRKWLQIAQRYEKFSPAEQARLQTRMTEWVKMTPQQRRLARENYQITRSLPAQKKTEAWNKYQQLPEEQKKNLAAAEKVPRRPGAVSALPSGKRLPAETTRQLHLEKKAPAGAISATARSRAPEAGAPAAESHAAMSSAGAPVPTLDTPREAATEATASSTSATASPDEPVRR
ncbi:transmembrane protein [Cupriavidus basilensis OR16]|uniref:Transmembrane protein n=1 Tax=Cupriavidus basilensis OR16 TaxID=1127483 RepID=H1S0E1_9BURK|nr:DUF3106 domain-containing protein [Cupriavidus basilensis]EHP44077.1 transmembrane protein [Cupriavidus basilensis OR16]